MGRSRCQGKKKEEREKKNGVLRSKKKREVGMYPILASLEIDWRSFERNPSKTKSHRTSQFSTGWAAHELPEMTFQRGLSEALFDDTRCFTAGPEKPKRYCNFALLSVLDAHHRRDQTC